VASLAERDRRYAALRGAMDASAHDAYLIAGRADGSERGRVHYVSDLSVMGGMTYVLLPRDRPPTLFQPAFVGRAWAETAGWVIDNRSALDPIAEVVDVLRELGLADGRVGIIGLEHTMPIADFRTLATSLAGALLEDATPAFDAVRVVKSAEELACLRSTSSIVVAAYEALEAVLRPGVTERAAVSTAIGEVRRLGGLGGFLHISRSGGFTALHPPTDDVIRPDDVVTFDFEYTGLEHYALELTRQYSFGGPPPDDIAATYAIQGRVFDRIAASLRPGQTTTALAALIRAAYAAEGRTAAGPEGWGPVQLHAHGIGLDFGEPPFIPGPEMVLESGMVLSLHPNIGPEDPHRPVVAVVDSVVVTPWGGDPLTPGNARWRVL